jgi:hypothetical protein
MTFRKHSSNHNDFQPCSLTSNGPSGRPIRMYGKVHKHPLEHSHLMPTLRCHWPKTFPDTNAGKMSLQAKSTAGREAQNGPVVVPKRSSVTGRIRHWALTVIESPKFPQRLLRVLIPYGREAQPQAWETEILEMSF